MDSLPIKLRPLIRRLVAIPDVSHKDIVSMIFVVSLADRLHRSGYVSVLNLSLVRRLCKQLEIQDLRLYVETASRLRWSYQLGCVDAEFCIVPENDMRSVAVLSRIGQSVLVGEITPVQGLDLISDWENKSDNTTIRKIESFYCNFPGRILLLPFASATFATVFFDGSWVDLGFAAASGLVAGVITWMGTLHEHVKMVTECLVAIITGMISVGAITAYPDSACFAAQTLGTLHYFLYGTAYALSIYEMVNGQMATGLFRFIQAVLLSYVLAFALALGVWMAAYGGSERFDAILVPCSEKTLHQIAPNAWFALLFPLVAIATLMQFRVALLDFFICLIIQTTAYGLEYLFGTVLEHSELVSNLVATFCATLASFVSIHVLNWLKLTELEISSTFHQQARDKKEDVTEIILDVENEEGNACTYVASFVDPGQAEGNKDRDEHVHVHENGDMWFCLLPALYLLVPGSHLFKRSFFHLMSAISSSDYSSAGASLGVSLFLIGLAQVLGMQLGFNFLCMSSKLVAWMSKRRAKRRTSQAGTWINNTRPTNSSEPRRA